MQPNPSMDVATLIHPNKQTPVLTWNITPVLILLIVFSSVSLKSIKKQYKRNSVLHKLIVFMPKVKKCINPKTQHSSQLGAHQKYSLS